MEGKIYNLETRTLEFAKRIAKMCKALEKSAINDVYIKQIMRSSTSVGANYREANEKLSTKDFLHRIKISRKECKETTYWIELIIDNNKKLEKRINQLLDESIELRKILSTIIDKSK
ncbi:MAG: four helix bundle protein [Candidatus Magasanikbacteria bacterium CG10_big_fil_rev_8_21_14_0_10_36_16]|uniref:Four helix bundle protein n=1 Tax=Candidatus Magasanikbacteria bacterium CG10_big_fil_rev_8_21_14_0_10_36_16 TaxID=1974645 RepID=A0A2H0U0H8_9BACT|nr:MAG: four helix bundle protein [Candidatus Magasanikbacteria bacterium CG10_big_fil_rev_8_21_14_0_10_36_16]